MPSTVSLQTSTWNQQVYQRLKLAFELGLKRQIFVAVCDDWTQTDALAARLQAEIGPHFSGHAGLQGAGSGLVSLNLQSSDPDPMAHIRRWLQYDAHSASYLTHFPAIAPRSPQGQDGGGRLPITTPGFQILGIETLIRQSAAVQWAFLGHLRCLPEHLSELDSSILLWMSRPWRQTIARSTPEFWQCCSGIFEFTGEPIPRRITATPLVPVHHEPIADRQATSELAPQPKAKLETKLDVQSDTTPVNHAELDRPLVARAHLAWTEPPEQAELPERAERAPDAQTIAPLLVANIQATRHLVASAEADPQPVLAQLVNLHRSRAEGSVLAVAYQHLGTIYRDRLDAERPDPRCIMVAIQAYECAVTHWQNSGHANNAINDDSRDRQLPMLTNDIGTLYWMLASGLDTDPERLLSLERSEAAYRQTLGQLDEREQPQAWVTIQENLGSVCSDRARLYASGSEPQVQAWSDAIAAYETALHRSLPDLDPRQLATLHSNLGTACWNLAQMREPETYLEQAIQAYRTALDFFTADRDALTHAMLQTNLGTAAWNLARHGRSRDHLQFAIRCYRAALVHRTEDRHPTGCAATNNNLGTAYWNLAETFDPQQEHESHLASLHNAIAAYERTVTIATQLRDRPDQPLSFDLHATYDNLGMVYTHLASVLSRPDDALDRRHCHDRAVHCYLRALEGYPDDHPRHEHILDELSITLRTLHDRDGLNAQNQVFSAIPAPLLAQLMRRI